MFFRGRWYWTYTSGRAHGATDLGIHMLYEVHGDLAVYEYCTVILGDAGSNMDAS